MKNSCDFSKGKRGRVGKLVPEPVGKVKITIRLDRGVVDYFLARPMNLREQLGTRLSSTMPYDSR